MRSTKECQYRRKSNVCSPSAYCPVRATAGFSEFVGTVVPIRDWAGSITAKSWLEPYTKNCARKGERAKIFKLENTFADGDGVARHDEKAPAASLGEALRVDLEN